VSLGAVIIEPELKRTFYCEMKPLETAARWLPEALKVCGFSREQTLAFPLAHIGMRAFFDWVTQQSRGRPIFAADNAGFDWQFVNYYAYALDIPNPFGHSSVHIGSLYKGLVKDTFKNFKHLRTVKHTHNALDDAMGNAGALLKMVEMGLKVNLE
jgi:hypothetical protein